MAKVKKVPQSLKNWFTAHFVIDLLFAIPLFLAPVWLLTQFGFTTIDTVTARLVASALFGIGGISFVALESKKETYITLLKLKIIWSTTAIIGLLWSLGEGAPKSVWAIVMLFLAFFGVWMYYLRKLS